VAVCVCPYVCLSERPCMCPCFCVSVCVCMFMCLCVSVCLCERPCMCPCARVSVCLCVSVCVSVYLCAITMVISGKYHAQRILAAVRRNCVLQVLLLMVSTCYKSCYLWFLRVTHFCYLRFQSICNPINKRFQH
jgi:hypothetical protein